MPQLSLFTDLLAVCTLYYALCYAICLFLFDTPDLNVSIINMLLYKDKLRASKQLKQVGQWTSRARFGEHCARLLGCVPRNLEVRLGHEMTSDLTNNNGFLCILNMQNSVPMYFIVM